MRTQPHNPALTRLSLTIATSTKKLCYALSDGTGLIWTASASPIITSASGFEERCDIGCLRKNGREVEPNGVEASTRLRCVKSGTDIASNIEIGRKGAFLAMNFWVLPGCHLRLPPFVWIPSMGMLGDGGGGFIRMV